MLSNGCLEGYRKEASVGYNGKKTRLGAIMFWQMVTEKVVLKLGLLGKSRGFVFILSFGVWLFHVFFVETVGGFGLFF